jgi:hypothetical protein
VQRMVTLEDVCALAGGRGVGNVERRIEKIVLKVERRREEGMERRAVQREEG